MKNKAIIITVVVLVLVAISSLIFIVVNSGEDNNTNIENNAVVENKVEEEKIEEKKDNGDNVAIDSKRGIEILKNLDFVSKLYSNKYYDELDSYGVSNNAKIIAAFIKIVSEEQYSSYIKQNEEEMYFSKFDLENVVKDTFSDTTQIIHTPVLGTDSYVAEEGNYIISSIGFSNLDYAIEIPYKITEYDTYVEVTSYRVYANTTVNSDNELEMKVTDTLYYDRAMLEEATCFENGELSNNEYNQVSFIREKINSKEIDVTKLVSVKYTLNKVEDKLLISDYKKGI